MTPVQAIVCDFGGVLTSPIATGFLAFQDSSGVSLEALGAALGAIAEHDGAHPLFELETGRMSEAEFLGRLGAELSSREGRPVEMDDFGDRYFEHLHANEPMIDYMRELRGRGLKMAICTNNVREWEARWRAMLPVDEIFHVVVDSGFVGMRKPEPGIYAYTLERLGVDADATLFVDDFEINCAAARELGMRAVRFESAEQAIEQIEAALS
jgi:epoxide hydrolase-like predicted phosphatase